jgi:hypothetical protein
VALKSKLLVLTNYSLERPEKFTKEKPVAERSYAATEIGIFTTMVTREKTLTIGSSEPIVRSSKIPDRGRGNLSLSESVGKA